MSRLTFTHQNGNCGCRFQFYPVSRTRQSVPLLVDFETETAAGFAQSVERWTAEREFAGLITGTEFIRRVLK